MPREDRSARQIVMRSAKTSCKNVRAILRLKGTAMSCSTLSRRLSKRFRLKSLGLYEARKPVMKQKRLDFVRRHRHWILAERNKVLLLLLLFCSFVCCCFRFSFVLGFFDECTIQFVPRYIALGVHWVSILT